MQVPLSRCIFHSVNINGWLMVLTTLKRLRARHMNKAQIYSAEDKLLARGATPPQK